MADCGLLCTQSAKRYFLKVRTVTQLHTWKLPLFSTMVDMVSPAAVTLFVLIWVQQIKGWRRGRFSGCWQRDRVMDPIQYLTWQYPHQKLECWPDVSPWLSMAADRKNMQVEAKSTVCAWGQVSKLDIGRRKTQLVTIRPVFAAVPKLIPLVNTVQTVFSFLFFNYIGGNRNSKTMFSFSFLRFKHGVGTEVEKCTQQWWMEGWVEEVQDKQI